MRNRIWHEGFSFLLVLPHPAYCGLHSMLRSLFFQITCLMCPELVAALVTCCLTSSLKLPSLYVYGYKFRLRCSRSTLLGNDNASLYLEGSLEIVIDFVFVVEIFMLYFSAVFSKVFRRPSRSSLNSATKRASSA